MGTPGTVRVFCDDVEILCFRRHADGYPEGLGREVADFCAQRKIVNGISSRHDPSKIANGAGCLAAQLVAWFTDGPGGIYIEQPGQEARYGYEYVVRCPGFQKVDAARSSDNAQAYASFEGLPVSVEAYDIEGGYGDVPLTKRRIRIPDAGERVDEYEVLETEP